MLYYNIIMYITFFLARLVLIDIQGKLGLNKLDSIQWLEMQTFQSIIYLNHKVFFISTSYIYIGVARATRDRILWPFISSSISYLQELFISWPRGAPSALWWPGEVQLSPAEVGDDLYHTFTGAKALISEHNIIQC